MLLCSCLNSSALDIAVAALATKAQGLFLYAYLLEKHLEAEAAQGKTIDFANLSNLPVSCQKCARVLHHAQRAWLAVRSRRATVAATVAATARATSRPKAPACLQTGLGEVYEANFRRSFPGGKGDPSWAAALPLVQVITAAMEPLNVEMAHATLGWDGATRERVLAQTSLLFPVRDGIFHVFHKTVVDWLTGDADVGSSLAASSTEFVVDRANGHARLAAAFDEWLAAGLAEGAGTEYWLRHGVVHVCRGGRLARAVEVGRCPISPPRLAAPCTKGNGSEGRLPRPLLRGLRLASPVGGAACWRCELCNPCAGV